LIVLKEFPADYREPLQSLLQSGFTRIPSLPMTRVSIDYASFDDYQARALNSHTRNSLRRKFRRTQQAPGIELSVITDVTPIIDDVYPLYLSVYERSELHFEKCTKAFFCRLGQMMPDKVCFFVWRRQGKVIAFATCMLHADAIYAEYVGFDYDYALDLHLYHYAYRDVVSWAISHGYKEFRSSGLNYDPKLHLRHLLDPLDLYVRHVSPPLNAVLRVLLPWLEPTHYDETLKKFANYQQLRG
jgi:predicted N-acyltransferase